MNLRFLIGFFAVFALVGPAAAEMGRAPASAGTYATLEGGYLGTYDIDLLGHGIAPAPGIVGPDRFVDGEHGWFIGVGLGLRAPTLPYFDRVEFDVRYSRAEDDTSDGSAGTQLTTLANTDATVLTVTGTRAVTDLDRDTIDTELALKKDIFTGATTSLTVGLVPFVRWTEETIESRNIGAGLSAFRSGDVDRWAYGVMLIAEPEFALSSATSLALHGGVGVYGYDADGSFIATSPNVAVFNSNVSDDDSGAGFRASLGAALKFQAGAGSIFSAFVKGDYWSDVPVADMTNQNPAVFDPSRLDSDEAWELRAGVRMTVSLP